MDGRRLEVNGFTFIEVIMALTIFAVGLCGVTGMWAWSQHLLIQSGLRTQALLLVRQKIEELREVPCDHDLGDPASPDAVGGGEQRFGPIHLVWSVQGARPGSSLCIIRVRASWAGIRGAENQVRLVGVHGPPGD